MDKFSKIKKKKKKKGDKLLYEGDYLKVYKRDDWAYIKEPDNACVVPILLDSDEFLVRMEVIPSFQSRDDQDYHLTCISGTIEDEESPKMCLVRELEEEAGIRLKDNVNIEFFDVLYKSKSQSSQFHLCILPLLSYQFDEVVAKGDGSNIEKMSKTVAVSYDNIDRLFPSDIVTSLLLEKVKEHFKKK